MRMKHRRLTPIAALLGSLACGGSEHGLGTTGPAGPTGPSTELPSLRSILETKPRRVGIGSAVGSYFGRLDADGVRYTAVLAREFDVITPENDLKFARLRPDRATFAFARPDSMLAFATANGMRMRGHTLVWHNQ